MTRKEQILQARAYLKNSVQEYGFSLGAEWADANPKDVSGVYVVAKNQMDKIEKLEAQLAVAIEIIEEAKFQQRSYGKVDIKMLDEALFKIEGLK